MSVWQLPIENERFSKMVSFLKKVIHRLLLTELLKGLKYCGEKVYIEERFTVVGRENISLGNSVYIGPNATIYAIGAPLLIKGHFMSGPGLTIITGDHRTDIKNRYMDEITVDEKLPENDQPVVIDEDVWIGANVTILKSVHIGQGSIVTAGAVVTKDIGQYEVWGGIPARKIKDRFVD